MRRFALYSDIHGNIAALDAVYADIGAAGITERYCLGDLVGYGPHPREVIARVRESGDAVLLGNYDDGIGHRRGGCGCYYPTPQAAEDGAASYVWTDAQLGDDEHAYLAGLPERVEFEAEGARVLLVHGSPRKLNEYLMPDRPESNLVKLAELTGADLICHGHVHIPMHRQVVTSAGRVAHFISDGSVGKPKGGDPRATWTEVTIERGADGPAVDARFHRVGYDVATVAAEAIAAGLPPGIAAAWGDTG